MDNLLLEHLKALRNEIATLRSEMHDEFKDVKHRLNSIEATMIGVKRDSTNQQDDIYRQQARIDQLTERIQKIENRLELTS
jgi:tetrahydromethanopterin S-methyltransferase subunit G